MNKPRNYVLEILFQDDKPRNYVLEILFQDDTKISIPLDPLLAERADATAAFSISGYSAGWLPYVEDILQGMHQNEVRYVYVIRDHNVVFRAEMTYRLEVSTE